jgi:hypothetical protein
VLFDIADIESHNAAGVKRVDGNGRELMWDEWTSDGGHLSAAGSQRVASALWWLMARIAGWSPTADPLSFHTLVPAGSSTRGTRRARTAVRRSRRARRAPSRSRGSAAFRPTRRRWR